MSLVSTMDKVNELFNSHKDKVSKRNDAFEAMVMASKEETIATMIVLSTRIEELEVELTFYRAAVGEGVSSAALSYKDRMENYFRAKGIVDDAVKFYPEFTKKEAGAKLQGITRGGTVGEYVREFKELMLQVSDVTKKEALLTFQNGLKFPYILKKCLKKFVLKEKPVGKALGLGLSERHLKAKEAKSEKKPVECFLCY
ncbi:hypothetical protein Godav_020691, partial [Gossypium davidsonii]|nr:hypothetical protein [Gossypium davidsonii]